MVDRNCVTNGILKKGDFFVSGNTWGKIRAMINDKGQNVDLATPSTPVEILGMSNSALSGDDFVVVESEDKAKEIKDYRVEQDKSNFKVEIFDESPEPKDNLDDEINYLKSEKVMYQVKGHFDTMDFSVKSIDYDKKSNRIVLTIHQL